MGSKKPGRTWMCSPEIASAARKKPAMDRQNGYGSGREEFQLSRIIFGSLRATRMAAMQNAALHKNPKLP